MDFWNDFLPALFPDPETRVLELRRLARVTDLISVPSFIPRPPLSALAYIHASLRPGHTLSVSFPDVFLLLYTVSGSGCLTFQDTSFVLDANTVCFLPLDSPASICAQKAPWEWRMLLLYGPGADYYCQLFQENAPLTAQKKRTVYSLMRQSSFPSSFSDFESSLKSALRNPLWQSMSLTELLTSLLTEIQSSHTEEQPAVQPYLLAIRQGFHDSFSDSYTLDGLEHTYGVSKFQIVREFTAAFGTSPIAYLNNCRILAAARLLLSTDKRINEIGSMVGIDNTNHFIRLFSRKYHATPGAWRKRQAIISERFPSLSENRLQ